LVARDAGLGEIGRIGRNRIKIIREKTNRSPMAISSLKGIGRNEAIKKGRGRIIVKMERRNTAVFSFSLIDVTIPNKKKRKSNVPITAFIAKIVSIKNV